MAPSDSQITTRSNSVLGDWHATLREACGKPDLPDEDIGRDPGAVAATVGAQLWAWGKVLGQRLGTEEGEPKGTWHHGAADCSEPSIVSLL